MAKTKKNNSIGIDDNSTLNEAALLLKDGINKYFGAGSITTLDDESFEMIDAAPTGAIAVDLALGIGGIPYGRITEVFGPEASAKTTVVLKTLANIQKAGRIIVYVDVEHAFDKIWAEKIGIVEGPTFLYSQPETGEQVFDIVEFMLKSGADIGGIAIDSIDGISPKAEIDGSMEDNQIGVRARLINKALRKINPLLTKRGTALILVNQLREGVGPFASKKVTPGGRGIKYYSSVRMETKKIEQIKEGARIIGTRHRATIVKSKVSPPHGSGEFEILFDEGISVEGGIVDLATEMGIIDKSGAFFKYGPDVIGHGRNDTRKFLKDNPTVRNEIEEKIRSNINRIVPVLVDDEEEDDE